MQIPWVCTCSLLRLLAELCTHLSPSWTIGHCRSILVISCPDCIPGLMVSPLATCPESTKEPFLGLTLPSQTASSHDPYYLIMHTHVCTHCHTYAHTCTQSDTFTHLTMNSHIHTLILTCSQSTLTCTRTNISIHAHMHSHILIHIHIETHL